MKTKYILLFFVCIFGIQLQANAGDFKILFNPDTTVKSHVSFNKTAFLDLRYNKEYVGSLRWGVKRSGIVPFFSLDSMLSHFAMKLTDSAVSKNDNTLLIALREINVEEKTNGEFEVGNIYLHIDFYLGNDDKYAKVLGVDTLFEFGIGNKPMLQLAGAFDQIFGGMLIAIADPRVQQNAPFYTKAMIQSSDSVFNDSYPVYHQAAQKGIYYSMESFLKNQPDDTLFVQMHNNNFDVITDKFYTSIDGKKKSKSLIDTGCFAVYNGRKWYTPFGNEFKEMKVRNGNFYYMDFGQGLILPSSNHYYYVPFGGGLVGALVAAGAQAAIYSAVNNKIGKGRMGDAVFRYKLNPQTGDGIKVERLQ